MRAGLLSVSLVIAGCGDNGTTISDDEVGADPEPPGPSGQGCEIWEPGAPKNLLASEPEFTPGSPSLGGPRELPSPRGTLLANQACCPCRAGR